MVRQVDNHKDWTSAKLDNSLVYTPFTAREFWPSQYFQSILYLNPYSQRKSKREWWVFNISKTDVTDVEGPHKKLEGDAREVLC